MAVAPTWSAVGGPVGNDAGRVDPMNDRSNKSAHLDPTAFSTPGEYSMDKASNIMHVLEREHACTFEDNSWKQKNYGNLVEKGIKATYMNIEFKIMCSYEDIFIYRVSGNKQVYSQLCNIIRQHHTLEA